MSISLIPTLEKFREHNLLLLFSIVHKDDNLIMIGTDHGNSRYKVLWLIRDSNETRTKKEFLTRNDVMKNINDKIVELTLNNEIIDLSQLISQRGMNSKKVQHDVVEQLKADITAIKVFEKVTNQTDEPIQTSNRSNDNQGENNMKLKTSLEKLSDVNLLILFSIAHEYYDFKLIEKNNDVYQIVWITKVSNAWVNQKNSTVTETRTRKDLIDTLSHTIINTATNTQFDDLSYLLFQPEIVAELHQDIMALRP